MHRFLISFFVLGLILFDHANQSFTSGQSTSANIKMRIGTNTPKYHLNILSIDDLMVCSCATGTNEDSDKIVVRNEKINKS